MFKNSGNDDNAPSCMLGVSLFSSRGGCYLVLNPKSKGIRVDFEVKLHNGQHKYAFKVKITQESPFKHIIAGVVRKFSEKTSTSKGCVDESSCLAVGVLLNRIVSVVCNISYLTYEQDDIVTTLDDLDSQHNLMKILCWVEMISTRYCSQSISKRDV